ncbi:TrbC/VirB2 family protein [Acidithiobacillus sp.]|uniref:TrbC/VirB2 family protein n=1 Tax=Acidithiobacillus sp. TaxID=1872118 RepID=UPI003D03FACD
MNKLRNRSRDLGVKTAVVMAGLLADMLPASAFASTAGGGGGMPWDGPLQTITESLTGPVAMAIAIGAFFVAGAILVFGEDMSAFVRRLLMVVIAVCLLVFGNKFLSAMGITGATV